MKQQQKKVITIICIISFFIILHLTPSLAVRTHLFVTGHPIYATGSRIVLDKFQYELNKDYFNRRNSKCYSITGVPIITSYGLYAEPNKPPIGNYIYSFQVRKIGFLYFASYFGEA